MKRFFLLLISCLLCSGGFSQNNILRGIVKLQSSGSKPLAGVKLSAFGSSPVYSNSSGQFEITFSNKKPGSTISLIIEKEDYEVINDKELDNCVLRERADDLVIVVMARQGERSKQALAYYNIIIENANTTFNKELKDINTRLDALDEDDQDRQVLRQQIEDLQKEKESLMNRAEDLAKQLAIVDLDQASSLAKTAYEKFQSGDIKAALAVLDDDALDKSLAEAKNEKANLEERLLKVDSALQQSIENYMIKARFCITDRQYKAAYKNYLKAVEADSTHVSNLWELASFCDELNQQQRAIRFFQQALNNTTSVANKASLLMNLGNQFTHNNSYEKAETAYLQSLEIYQRLAKENPQRYEPDVASTQMNLGVMYYSLNAYEKAEQAYLQSLEIRKRLAKENPQRYEPDVARTQMNLGGMYYSLNAYEKAEQAYLQSLEIYQRLAKENPQRYEPDVASTQMNLGVMYRNLNAYEKAEQAYLQSLEIYQRLAKENPQRYEPDVARTQMNLGVMYYSLNAYEKAEQAYLQSLEIYQRLAKENPQRYEPDVARTQMNLGVMYRNLNAYEKAEQAYLQSLEIYQRLAKENPQRYEPDVARTQMNLGLMYSDLNAYEKAEQAYLQSLEIRKRLAKENPQRYEPDVARTQMNLGVMYRNLNAYEKAEQAYLQSLEIYQRLAKENPQRYEPDVASTQMNLGVMYRNLNAYEKTEQAYLQSLEIYQRLAKENPQRYEPDVARTQMNLGVMYRNLNAYKKAEQAYLQSLETYQRLAKENPQRFDIDLCRTLLNIGYFKKALLEKRLDLRFQKEGQEIIQQVKVILGGYEDTLPIIKAFKSHYHTLDTYFNGITEEALIIQQAINKVVPYEEKNQTEKNPALVVTNQEMVISLLETTLKDYPNNQQLLTRTANAYGNMAWYYLFNRQFAEATQAAQRGLGLDETQEWINTNLALGLLYQGKMEDATALYSRLKDLPYNNATYKSTFLEDLVALEKEGITCAGVEEIRRLLGE